jgi:hypothetical protein
MQAQLLADRSDFRGLADPKDLAALLVEETLIDELLDGAPALERRVELRARLGP